MATLTVTSTADSGSGSLRQAISDATNGDTIIFDATTFPANTETTIDLSSSISVNKRVTIDGGDTWTENGELKTRVILDGQGDSSYRLLTATTQTGTDVLNIKSITFYNGGGVGVQKTYTTFDSCVFKNNYLNQGGGLAVNYTALNTIINNCVFNTCNAAQGGGVYCYSSANFTLNNCVFKNCKATGSGSCLYVTTSAAPTINNCTFERASDSTAFSINLNNTTGTNTIHGENTVDYLNVANGATVTFDGVDAVLAVTDTLTDAGATFQASTDSTGYLALYDGANVPTVGNGVKTATYGAGLEAFSIAADGASWTAENLSTAILIEKQNGSSWETLTNSATGGEYETTFVNGDVARAFDGVRFIEAELSKDAVVSVFGSDWADVARYALGIKTNPDTPL